MRRLDERAWGLAAMVAVAGVGLFAAFAGRNISLPELDRIYAIEGAIALFEAGEIPQKGNVTSLGSFGPPGATWFMIPGYLTTDSTALWEPIGCSILYLAAVFGIYALARRPFGTACALLAAALFALSPLGIFFARTGLGYGHAAFYAAFLFFLWRWVEAGRGVFLAAALLAWAVGMNVFVSLAPMIAAVPVVWWAFRPPLAWRPLFAAAAAGLVLWAPYLWFDAGTGFSNLASQLTMTSRVPSDFERTWNDPGLRPFFERQTGGISMTQAEGGPPDQAAGEPPTPRKAGIWLGKRIGAFLVALTADFRISLGSAPAKFVANILLAAAMMLTLCAGLGGGTETADRGWRGTARAPLGGRVLVFLAVAALGAGLLVNEWTVARYLSVDQHLWPSEIEVIRAFQGTLVLAAVAILWRRRLAELIASMREQVARANLDRPGCGKLLRFLTLAYLSSVLPLALLAHPAHDRRFFWLWPAQCLLFAFFLVHLLPVLLRRRPTHAVSAMAIVALLWWPPLAHLAGRLAANGVFGRPDPAYAAIAAVAERLAAEGRSQAWIGYHVPFAGFEASYNVIDPRYKVGATFDLVLRRRHKIVNRNTFAEGIHPNDEYRIVAPAPAGKSMSAYAPVPRSGFREIAKFGPYAVLERQAPTLKPRAGNGA